MRVPWLPADVTMPSRASRTFRKVMVRSGLATVLYFGSSRHCTVCNRSSRKFLSFGVFPRPDAQCPQCSSLERHRLAIVFLRERTDLFDGLQKRFLHIAPERCFVRMFSEAAGAGYLTADLLKTEVMESMDITDISWPDGSFDVIYCSPVLEHVVDDCQAMRELCRVLAPSGWAMLNVPITANETYEDPSVTDPTERVRQFGQKGHVRRYGPDYMDRLTAAGFDVTRISAGDLVSDANIERYGLANGASGDLFYCMKKSG